MAVWALTIICILLCVGMFCAGWKLMMKEDEDDQIDFFNSRELADDVEALHERMKRLQELDNMLQDIQLCRPSEALRAFRMEWQGVAKNHSVEFMADGQSDTSAIMMELAEAEREQLNDEIGQRIASLYFKACKLQLIEDLTE
jgi:hypothetical protein